jgi:hypothetical protein
MPDEAAFRFPRQPHPLSPHMDDGARGGSGETTWKVQHIRPTAKKLQEETIQKKSVICTAEKIQERVSL